MMGPRYSKPESLYEDTPPAPGSLEDRQLEDKLREQMGLPPRDREEPTPATPADDQ